MDAPGWNGEPGALSTDPEWDERPDRDQRPMMTCSDCGVVQDNDMALISTTGKLLCGWCRTQRGFKYMWDPRSWSVIEADLRKGAA